MEKDDDNDLWLIDPPLFVEYDLSNLIEDSLSGIEHGILTKSGISFPDGTLISDCEIFQVAKELEQLLENGDPIGFYRYFYINECIHSDYLWGRLGISEKNALIHIVKIYGGKYLEGTHRIIDIINHIQRNKELNLN